MYVFKVIIPKFFWQNVSAFEIDCLFLQMYSKMSESDHFRREVLLRNNAHLNIPQPDFD